jgi:hypothetical protein
MLDRQSSDNRNDRRVSGRGIGRVLLIDEFGTANQNGHTHAIGVTPTEEPVHDAMRYAHAV